jgi:hypothetical protein
VKSDNIPVFVSGHFKLPSGVQAHLVDVEVIYLCHYAFVFLHVTKHIQNKPAQTAINRGIVVEIGGNFTARNSCASSRKNPKDSYLSCSHILVQNASKNMGQS